MWPRRALKSGRSPTLLTFEFIKAPEQKVETEIIAPRMLTRGAEVAVIKGLWNYAVKADDIEKVAAFYTGHMGASLMFRGEVYGCKYVLIRLGSTRVILFDKAPYEKELNLNLPPGFLHAVYEVDDFEREVENLHQFGTKFLMEPRILEGEFGVRKIAFFQAPDGTRIEVMQVLKDSGKAG